MRLHGIDLGRLQLCFRQRHQNHRLEGRFFRCDKGGFWDDKLGHFKRKLEDKKVV